MFHKLICDKVAGVKVYPRQTWNFRSHAVSACIDLWHHRLMHADTARALLFWFRLDLLQLLWICDKQNTFLRYLWFVLISALRVFFGISVIVHFPNSFIFETFSPSPSSLPLSRCQTYKNFFPSSSLMLSQKNARVLTPAKVFPALPNIYEQGQSLPLEWALPTLVF